VTRLVFLLEESSMQEVLEIILPKILPAGVEFLCIPHEGKQDLARSIPRKLRAWRSPEVRFVVIHDQDSVDCVVLKQQLLKLCEEGGRPETLVRIVCHELESWFLGDLGAVETAYQLSGLAKRQQGRKFRQPDELNNAAQELKRLVRRYQKLEGARRIAPHMNLGDANRSRSFHIFLAGLRRLCQN